MSKPRFEEKTTGTDRVIHHFLVGENYRSEIKDNKTKETGVGHGKTKEESIREARADLRGKQGPFPSDK